LKKTSKPLEFNHTQNQSQKSPNSDNLSYLSDWYEPDNRHIWRGCNQGVQNLDWKLRVVELYNKHQHDSELCNIGQSAQSLHSEDHTSDLHLTGRHW